MGRHKLTDQDIQVRLQEGRYYQLEITVSTPDDGGNDVHLDFGNSSKPIPPDYGIITVRVVDDTTPEIAHQMYQ